MSDFIKTVCRNMGLTQREFKALKRRQLTTVLQACDDLNFGIAASPGYDEITHAMYLLRKAREKQSAKSWGR